MVPIIALSSPLSDFVHSLSLGFTIYDNKPTSACDHPKPQKVN